MMTFYLTTRLGRTQKFVEKEIEGGGAKTTFCKFYGTVAVKTFFNILNVMSENLFITVTCKRLKMTLNVILRGGA